VVVLESATTSRAAGMRKAPGRGRGNALLVIADLFNSLDKPLVLFSSISVSRDHPATVEPFQFTSRQGGAAYQGG